MKKLLLSLTFTSMAQAGEVKIAWNNSNPPGTVTVFEVYEKAIDATSKKVGEFDGKLLQGVLVLPEGTHTIYLVAKNDTGISGPSNDLTFTLLSKPLNLQLTK